MQQQYHYINSLQSKNCLIVPVYSVTLVVAVGKSKIM